MQIAEIVYITILIALSYFTFFHLILWFEGRDKSKGKQKTKLPNVSILVPAYNEGHVIEKSLERLMGIDYPRDKLDIIVIDDGSIDNTYAIAKKFEARNVRVLRKRNSGKASTLNFGLKHARHEFVAVMDADSFMDRKALKECVAHFDGDDVAAVTSHIIVKRRKTLWEKLQHTEHMIVAVMRKAQEGANVINVTPGPLSVYRKDVLEKLGGFDERSIIEDVEIAWRILKHGYKIRMAFNAMVYSIYPDSFSMWFRQRRRWVVGGLQTFFKYFNTIFDRKSHGVGNWIIPTSLVGYVFALTGTSIFAYLASMKIFNFALYAVRAFSLGSNPFTRFEFAYSVDLLFIYGVIMFALSLFIIRLSIGVHSNRPSLPILLLFLTLYPTLLTANLLISLYKFARMERSWLTK